jgi:hypothetical protein
MPTQGVGIHDDGYDEDQLAHYGERRLLCLCPVEEVLDAPCSIQRSGPTERKRGDGTGT